MWVYVQPLNSGIKYLRSIHSRYPELSVRLGGFIFTENPETTENNMYVYLEDHATKRKCLITVVLWVIYV
jgi:hypothetical protein